MAKIIYFVTGGARSGKSSFAEERAAGISGKRAYIATAEALDTEMAERIDQHKRKREDSWETFEETLDVAGLIGKLKDEYDVVLVDCLTLWLSNVLAQTDDDSAVLKRFHELAGAIRNMKGSCIIVSNEVGLGIVPDNLLARRFRDLAGILNRQMAQAADDVYFMAAGIPMKIK